jgi:hypothetical protein
MAGSSPTLNPFRLADESTIQTRRKAKQFGTQRGPRRAKSKIFPEDFDNDP